VGRKVRFTITLSVEMKNLPSVDKDNSASGISYAIIWMKMRVHILTAASMITVFWNLHSIVL
jgi:hypothetical protein